MDNLLFEDVKWCLTRLPKALLKMLKEEKSQLALAGGFVRSCITNEKASDIDLFSKDKKAAELYARRYNADKGRILETCNAYTVLERSKTPVQFIHRWSFEDVEEILPSFDFTIACALIYFDGQNWRGMCDSRYYADLAAKRLTYRSPVRIEEAGGSILRVLKFYQKGYRIPLDSFAKTIARLSSGVDWDAVQGDEALGQMPTEARHAFVLSGLLREVDPQTDPTERAYYPLPDSEEEEPVELKGT